MGRAPCCDKTNVKRGPWSPEEDAALRNYLHRHGTGGNWIALPQKAGLKRCGKSCRLRWLNYLRPDIKHGGFTEEEDNIICTLYRSLGSRWSVIASKLQCRTDNDVKNYWNTKLKKKVMMASAAAAAGQANLAAQQQQPRVPLPLPPTSLTYVVPMEFNPGFNIDQNPIIFNGSANSRYVISPPAPGTAQENSYEYMSWAANSSNCGSGGGGGGEDDIHGGLMMGMSQLEESSPPDLLNWYGFQSRIGEAASYNNYDGSSSSGLPNMGANAIEGKPSHGLYLESLAYL